MVLSGGALVNGTRVAWMLEMQKREGDRYWRLLDRTDPNWIEDWYDAVLGTALSSENKGSK
jgi:hypothetical protein